MFTLDTGRNVGIENRKQYSCFEPFERENEFRTLFRKYLKNKANRSVILTGSLSTIATRRRSFKNPFSQYIFYYSVLRRRDIRYRFFKFYQFMAYFCEPEQGNRLVGLETFKFFKLNTILT